jgi:hypothetical protein
VAVITYVGNGFSIEVPRDWQRLATPQHLAVFLGEESRGVRSSMALSHFAGASDHAAAAARSDHSRRMSDYEVIDESQDGGDSFYRRYRWVHDRGVPMIQHQLFSRGVVLTCSRVECSSTDQVEAVFLVATNSLRVNPELPRPAVGDL